MTNFVPINDEQRLAWARVNWAADVYGDSPEYRREWAAWERLVRGEQTEQEDD